MSTTYKYKFKPKGKGYNVWVTKQRHGKPHNTPKKDNGILGKVVADVAARAIDGAISTNQKQKFKPYHLCRDPVEAMRQRREADAKMDKELDLPQNNKLGGSKMDALDLKIVDSFGENCQKRFDSYDETRRKCSNLCVGVFAWHVLFDR